MESDGVGGADKKKKKKKKKNIIRLNCEKRSNTEVIKGELVGK